MVKAVLFDLDGTLYDYDSCNSISETGLAGTISECFGVSVDRAYELLRTAKSNVKQRLGVGVAASHNRMLYMQEICELERKIHFNMRCFFTMPIGIVCWSIWNFSIMLFRFLMD